MNRKDMSIFMLANYDAIAYIHGSSDYPDIMGTVGFKKAGGGTWVDADIKGLPRFREATEDSPQVGPHGFHIHENPCGDNFEEAGGHYNPSGAPHGNHDGDMPALFSNGGTAKMLFYTDKFTPEDIIGRSVVIHLSPDDYMTQPAGGSGERIACGDVAAHRI